MKNSVGLDVPQEDKASHQAPKVQALGDFDPRVVHTRDPKTGRVIRVNPFKLIVERGKRYYEHPVGSGNLWYEDRTTAGRFEKGSVILGADHKVYVMPLTEDQKLARKHAQLEQENIRLAQELEAIKLEQTRKTDIEENKASVKKSNVEKTKS